ncbi:putative cupredoxin [Lupinus albus]|uniref:Putative cupredoxin n=1 Tax=Lupinus albus TaxID=3870 RepID=A0A6A4Q8D6_LUPAL|nr:putative cupredoxin [Lupinus albus]
MSSLSSVSPLFFIMFLVFLLISCCQGFEFVVGGSKYLWKVPLDSQDSLNRWAQSQLFNIGDTLVFKYDSSTESVHVVNKKDYLACNTLGNHSVFQDGNSKFHLRDSGPIHFISGSQGHCQMGLKLVVVLMSPTPAAAAAGNETIHSPPISLALPSPGPSAHPPSIKQAVPHTSDAVFISAVTGLGVSLAMIIFLT